MSQFTNDLGNYGGFVTGTPWTSMGYLTSYTETDPTISVWAKAATKPTYTAAEVGAPSGSGNSTGTNTGDNAVNSLYSGLAVSKQDTLNGTGFVKSTAGTISYDTNTYLTSINSGNVTTALGYTPYNATNPAGYISSYTETDPTISAWAKAVTKPTYTASEVGLGNVPNLSFSGSNTGDETTSSIKTKLGQANTTTDGYISSVDWNTFNNKQPAGSYLTSYTETDPTISAWAKDATKPSYFYSEISSTPTLLSQFTNDLGNYGGFVTGTPWTSMGYVTGTPWTAMGYLTSYTETDPTIYAWAKATTKPSYIWTEIGSRPTSLSQFTNDLGNYGGFLTSYTETDPTVYAWAKAATKPTYTASEVGLGNVANESKATMFASPTFTGTVSGITAAMVGAPSGSGTSTGTNTGDETTTTIKTKLGAATTSADGYLTSTDWNIFNSKQPAGSYLTSYTETDPTISAWAKAATKPTYSYSEISSTPTLLSQFTNDLGNYGGFVTGTPWTSMGYVTGTPWTSMGYLTSYTETDPTISAWAKAATKPSYTSSDVGLGNVTNESKATMFTNPTLTGTSNISDISITGSIIPTVDNFYYLGSPSFRWHSLYVGPGSIYVNGQKVLQTDMSNSVVMSADDAQNVIIKTTGGGNVELNPASGGGGILLKSNVTLTAGKSFRTSDLTPVIFSDGTKSGNINIAGNTISSGNTNGDIEFIPNGAGRTYVSSGNFGVGTSSPSTKLDVNGNTLIRQKLTVADTSDAKVYSSFGTNVTSHSLSNASDVLFSGNVEVDGNFYLDSGSISIPTGAVSGDFSVTGIMKLSDGLSTAPSYTFANDTDTGLWRGGINTLGFSTGGLEAMRIDSSGRVGIGMTNPTEKLNVTGNILATGTILGSNISGTTSGTNTGDNAVNSLYSSLVTMTYPAAGIPISNGTAWGTSIADNSANWNTAYSQTRQWDGGSTGLVAATGRTSLGLGTAALNNAGDFVAYRTFGTAANNNTGDFLAYNATAVDSDKLDGQHGSYYATASGYVPYTGGTSNVDLGVHNLTVDMNSLFVDATNHRVGIGTITPGSKLSFAADTTAAGGINFGGDTNLYRLSANNLMTDDYFIAGAGISSYGTLDMTTNNISRMGTINFGSSNDVNLYRDSADKLRTNDALIVDGSLGVGTATPGFKLDVNGEGRFGTSSKNITLYANTPYIDLYTNGSSEPYITTSLWSNYFTKIGYSTGNYGYISATTNGSTGNLSLNPTGGNVGIGTTSPSLGNLQINGNAGNQNSKIAISSGTWGEGTSILGMGTINREWNLVADTYTTNNYRLHFDYAGTDGVVNNILSLSTTGNVGIGTTGPSQKLQVAGNIALDAELTERFIRVAGSYGGAIRFRGNASAGDDRALQFGTMDGNNLFTPRMTVDTNNGNIGIGTTTPTTKFQIYGSTAGVNGDLITLGGSGYDTMFGMDTTGAYIYQTSANRNFSFGSAGSRSQLILAGNGNVGIGGTPAVPLDVVGTIRSRTSAGVSPSVSLYQPGSAEWAITNPANTSRLSFMEDATTEHMIIDTNGNVGIGTTSPTTKLAVQISAGPYNTNWYNTNTATTDYNANTISGAMTSAIGYFGIGGATTANTSFRDSFVVGTQSAHSLNLNTSDTARMTILSSGNV